MGRWPIVCGPAIVWKRQTAALGYVYKYWYCSIAVFHGSVWAASCPAATISVLLWLICARSPCEVPDYVFSECPQCVGSSIALLVWAGAASAQVYRGLEGRAGGVPSLPDTWPCPASLLVYWVLCLPFPQPKHISASYEMPMRPCNVQALEAVVGSMDSLKYTWHVVAAECLCYFTCSKSMEMGLAQHNIKKHQILF